MGYIEELRQLVGSRPLILVGAVVLLLNKKGEVLLQQRTEPAGKWGLPGGLMELGEAPEQTAKREVEEETGLRAGSLQLLDVFSGRNYFTKLANGDEFQSVTIAYYTEDYEGQLTVNEEEGSRLQFFAVDALPAYMVGSHRAMIQQYALRIAHK